MNHLTKILLSGCGALIVACGGSSQTSAEQASANAVQSSSTPSIVTLPAKFIVPESGSCSASNALLKVTSSEVTSTEVDCPQNSTGGGDGNDFFDGSVKLTLQDGIDYHIQTSTQTFHVYGPTDAFNACTTYLNTLTSDLTVLAATCSNIIMPSMTPDSPANPGSTAIYTWSADVSILRTTDASSGGASQPASPPTPVACNATYSCGPGSWTPDVLCKCRVEVVGNPKQYTDWSPQDPANLDAEAQHYRSALESLNCDDTNPYSTKYGLPFYPGAAQ